MISLANILHRAGVPNDALVVTNMALEISPKFVVIHFTMANIYVTKVERGKIKLSSPLIEKSDIFFFRTIWTWLCPSTCPPLPCSPLSNRLGTGYLRYSADTTHEERGTRML